MLSQNRPTYVPRFRSKLASGSSPTGPRFNSLGGGPLSSPRSYPQRNPYDNSRFSSRFRQLGALRNGNVESDSTTSSTTLTTTNNSPTTIETMLALASATQNTKMTDVLSSDPNIANSFPIFQRYVALSDAKLQQTVDDLSDLSGEIQLNKQRLAKTAQNTVNIFKKMVEINEKSDGNSQDADVLDQNFKNLATNVENFEKRVDDIETNESSLSDNLDKFKIEFEADLNELDSKNQLSLQSQKSERDTLISDLSKQMSEFMTSFNESLAAEKLSFEELEGKLDGIAGRVEQIEINGIIADSTTSTLAETTSTLAETTSTIAETSSAEPSTTTEDATTSTTSTSTSTSTTTSTTSSSTSTEPEPAPQSTTDLYAEYQDQSDDLLHFLSGEPTELRTADNYCLTFSDQKSMKAYNPVIESEAMYHLATWELCNNQPNQWFRAVDNTLRGYIPAYTGIGAEDYLTSLDGHMKCLTPLPISQAIHANLDSCDLWQWLEGAGTYLFAVDCYEESENEPVNYQKFRFDSDLSIMHSECDHQLNLGSMGRESTGYRAFLTSSVATDTFSSAKVIVLDFAEHLSNDDTDNADFVDSESESDGVTPHPEPENDHNIPVDMQEPNLMSFLNGNPSQIKGVINGQTYCLSAQDSSAMAVYNPSEGNFTTENELLWKGCLEVDIENMDTYSSSEIMSFSNQLFIYDHISNNIQLYLDETSCVTPMPISESFHTNLDSCDVWNLLPKAGTYLFMSQCGSNPDALAQQFQYNYQNKYLESKCAHKLPLGKNGYYDSQTEQQVIRAFLTESEFTFSTGSSVQIDFTVIAEEIEDNESIEEEEEEENINAEIRMFNASPEGEHPTRPESEAEAEQYSNHVYLSDLVYNQLN